MKVTFKPLETLSFEVDAPDDVSLVQQLSRLQNVFSDSCCGKCKSVNIEFRVRKAQKYTYYERVCRDCKAKLDYGQHRDNPTMLYPKRTAKEGERTVVLQNNGWYHWEGSPPPAPVPTKAIQRMQQQAVTPKGDAYEEDESDPPF